MATFQSLRLPRVQQGRAIVDGSGMPTTDFVTTLNNTFSAIELAYNGIASALNAAGIAQAAADAANIAAAAATAAASSANAAAGTAQSTADAAAKNQALVNSYISPSSVVTATLTLVTISAHTRFYADGTSVSVLGGTAATVGGAGAVDYVSYLDPSRAGGNVGYVISTTAPVQTGNTHVVGAVTVPATGSASGGNGPAKPGGVTP